MDIKRPVGIRVESLKRRIAFEQSRYARRQIIHIPGVLRRRAVEDITVRCD